MRNFLRTFATLSLAAMLALGSLALVGCGSSDEKTPTQADCFDGDLPAMKK